MCHMIWVFCNCNWTIFQQTTEQLVTHFSILFLNFQTWFSDSDKYIWMLHTTPVDLCKMSVCRWFSLLSRNLLRWSPSVKLINILCTCYDYKWSVDTDVAVMLRPELNIPSHWGVWCEVDSLALLETSQTQSPAAVLVLPSPPTLKTRRSAITKLLNQQRATSWPLQLNS